MKDKIFYKNEINICTKTRYETNEIHYKIKMRSIIRR
jgi:hypothetical protein